MEYIPFGETLFEEHLNSEVSPYLFNGKERDAETGFYYYGARYYDPKISLWLSVDPLVEKTMDAYGYCYQNPVNLVDPTGKIPTAIIGFFIGALSDYIGQAAFNYFIDDSSLEESLTTKINKTDVLKAGGWGMITGGIGSLRTTLMSKGGKMMMQKIIGFGFDLMIGVIDNALSQVGKKNFDVMKVMTGAVIDATLSGLLPKKYLDNLKRKLNNHSNKLKTIANNYQKKFDNLTLKLRNPKKLNKWYKNGKLDEKYAKQDELYLKQGEYDIEATKYKGYVTSIETIEGAVTSYGSNVLKDESIYKKDNLGKFELGPLIEIGIVKDQ